MRSITELPIADLREAGDAAETLIELRAYLPPEELLVMLAGRFRDEIREALEMRRLKPACRGPEGKPLDELTSSEFERLVRAVDVLVNHFTPFMDDPELIPLLSGLHELLRIQSVERAQLQASIGVS